MAPFMVCGFSMSLRTITILTSIGIVLFNEHIIYLIYSLSWPDLPVHYRDPEDTQVILFVADPQIQGYQDEPGFPFGSFSRWDADRYLKQTFNLAFAYSRPDLVIYLGDLMDEGSKATEEEYKTYFYRFLNIYSQAQNAKKIYIPGDNDIGGELRDLKTDFKISRFEKHFQARNGVDKFGFIDFIKMDLQTNNEPFLPKKRMAEEMRKRLTSPFRMLLSHETVLPKPKFTLYPFLKIFQPHIIMSAHWHKSNVFVCDDCLIDDSDHWSVHMRDLSWMEEFMTINMTISPFAVSEVMVPTCSYRMGVQKMGFGLAVIERKGIMKYGILWLPRRYPLLYLYIVVIGFLTALNAFYTLGPKLFGRRFMRR